MKTMREFGNFLRENHLSCRVGLMPDGFHVDLLRNGKACISAWAPLFPDTVDIALRMFANQKLRNTLLSS